MDRKAGWALLLALAVSLPFVGANPDSCQSASHGRVLTAPDVTVDQTTHACAGSTGSQTLDRYDVNVTGPLGRHNVTYRSETDTGDWEPSWCRYAPGSARCSWMTLSVDDQTNLTLRYRENADASWCQYSVLVERPGFLYAQTAPRNDTCFDYVTLLP